MIKEARSRRARRSCFPLRLRLISRVNVTTGFDVGSYLHWCLAFLARSNQGWQGKREETAQPNSRFPLDPGYPGVLISPPALTLVFTFIGVAPFSRGRTTVGGKRTEATQPNACH
jgi:hypothetical protein